MEYKRLNQNISILNMHNHNFRSVLQLTDGKKTENQVIDEIVHDAMEILNKIEQGTLVELPCKVGDTVYFAVDNGWDCAEIDEIHIFKDDIVFEWVQYDRGYELTELWDSGDFSIRDIGKSIFLTREEAEAKLKELQNG